MRDKVYIVASRSGVHRMTKNPPSLSRGELAVALTVTVPESAFREPTIAAKLDVPEDAIIHPQINVEVAQGTLATDAQEKPQ